MATTKISGVKNPLFLYKQFTYQYTVAANANLTITKSQLGYTVPSGYIFAGIRYFNLGTFSMTLVGIRPGEDQMIYGKNLTSSSVTNTCTVQILFVPLDMLKMDS